MAPSRCDSVAELGDDGFLNLAIEAARVEGTMNEVRNKAPLRRLQRGGEKQEDQILVECPLRTEDARLQDP